MCKIGVNMLLSSIFLLSSSCIVEPRPGQAGARLGRAERFSWLWAVRARLARLEGDTSLRSQSCDVREK